MSPPSLPFSLEFGNLLFSSSHGFFTELLGQAFFLPGLVELTVGYVICSFFFLTWICWTAIHWMSRKPNKSESSLCGCPVTFDPAVESEDTSVSLFNKQRLTLSSEVNTGYPRNKRLVLSQGTLHYTSSQNNAKLLPRSHSVMCGLWTTEHEEGSSPACPMKPLAPRCTKVYQSDSFLLMRSTLCRQIAPKGNIINHKYFSTKEFLRLFW